MGIVHLISGLPCSGKTTYSNSLQETTNGVHFWLDYWLITLFGRYSIEAIGHDEHVRRVEACRTLIWNVSCDFLQREIDVILDDGFFLRAHRARYIEMAQQIGARVRIHYLNTPIELIRTRLERRNANLPQFNFPITLERFEMFAKMYEPPALDEGVEVVVTEGVSS